MKQIFASVAVLAEKFGVATQSRSGVTLNCERRETILDHVGDTWRCWRLRSEPDRKFAFRLAVHLETLAVALEDDLKDVLAAEKQIIADTSSDE